MATTADFKGPEGQESLSKKPATDHDEEKRRLTLSEHLPDLSSFIERAETVTPEMKEQWLKSQKRLDERARTADNTAIAIMRRAAITEDRDNQDSLQKHVRLAALYLKRDKTSTGRLSFEVNFNGIETAENSVGCGDMFPSYVRVIRVEYPDGRVVERATRGIKNSRIGFNDAKTGLYVPVFTGTKVTVLETESSITPEAKRHELAEHVAIYQPPKSQADVLPARMPKNKSEAGPGLQKKLEQTVTIDGKPFPAVDRAHWERIVGYDPAQTERFIARTDPVAGEKISFMGSVIPDGVNVLMLPYLMEAQARLKEAGIKDDIHNATCTCWRKERGGSTQSYHSWGVAIDLNPQENPMGKKWDELDQHKRISQGFVAIMKSVGFEWGGDWTGRPDGMHFRLLIDPMAPGSVSMLKSPESQSYLQHAIKTYKQYHPEGLKVATTPSAAGEKMPPGLLTWAKGAETNTKRWAEMVKKACARSGISQYAGLVRAFMNTESGGNPEAVGYNRDSNGNVVSYDQGLMQLNSNYFSRKDIMDPQVNIDTAVRHIAGLIGKYKGDMPKIIQAYNCGHAEGEAAVPASTINIYVPRVLASLKVIQEQQDGSDTAMA